MNLDFTNLRKITGGDAILESELFQIFLDSSKECLLFLKQGLENDDVTLWRTQAHALKGISLAIGAEELGTLCRHAQEHCQADPAEKIKMLTAIEHAFHQVEDHLNSAPAQT